jgi:hypothetical protein
MQSDTALELGITARWIVAALRLVRGSARLPDDQELGGGIETLLPKLPYRLPKSSSNSASRAGGEGLTYEQDSSERVR